MFRRTTSDERHANNMPAALFGPKDVISGDSDITRGVNILESYYPYYGGRRTSETRGKREKRSIDDSGTFRHQTADNTRTSGRELDAATVL